MHDIAQAAPPSADPADPSAVDEVSSAGSHEHGAQGVPPGLLDRFGRDGDRYLFQDGVPAFTDLGHRLRVHTNNPEVARTLVAIALHRGWPTTRIAGTRAFRRALWEAARRANLPTTGYAPTRDDLDCSQAGIHGGAPQATADPPTTPSVASDTRPNSALSGRLVDHGPAHYRFDGLERLSYFVRLQTEHGERTLWGVDLERAIAESASAVRPGDDVEVRNLGSRPIAVRQQRRNASGVVVGESIVETHRNSWQIETRAHIEERRAAADALRRAQAIDADVANRHVALAQAIAVLHVASLGLHRHSGLDISAQDRQRILDHLRAALATRVERGEPVPAILVREGTERTQARSTPRREHFEHEAYAR